MNAVLYYQRQKKDAKNRQIYIGEDAYPYSDGKILIAADGLGGRGGYPHTKFDRGILDRDRLYDIVFAPIFETETSDEYKEFVLKSFSELFETKEYYFENSATTRCSGYFASRFVTAIALYELKYNPVFDKDAIFSKIREAEPENRERVAQFYGDRLATLIQIKLTKIAQNLGFEVETRVAGAYLLPSTLTVAIVDEHEDDLDVLYLWAGDSRGYIWDADGLSQITDDHEEGETMTNLVTLSKPFKCEARLMSFKKPCILFNATDGCYKCKCFASPFDLEYIFLKSIDDSVDLDDSTYYLAEQFGMIGDHDDSNTMAMSMYGYEDYKAVQKAVRARLKVIGQSIVGRLHGILTRDYPTELAEVERQIDGVVLSLKDRLIEDEAVVAFVKENMEGAAYVPLMTELNTLTRQRNALFARASEIEQSVRRWVQTHWISAPQLKRYSAAARDFKGGFLGMGKKDPYEIYDELAFDMGNLRLAHTRSVERVRDSFREASARIEEALEAISDIGRTKSYDYSLLDSERERIADAFNYFKVAKGGSSEELVKYNEALREIKSLNDSYAEYDRVSLEELCRDILEGAFSLDRIGGKRENTEELAQMLAEYKDISGQVDAINDEIKGLPDKYLMRYWNEKHPMLLSLIWNGHRELIPDELEASVCEATGELNAKRAELKAACELREEIYAEYDANYRRFYRGSRI